MQPPAGGVRSEQDDHPRLHGRLRPQGHLSRLGRCWASFPGSSASSTASPATATSTRTTRILTPRLREAAADQKCQGLVLWSEISHSDTFLLEYLGANSWQPRELELPAAVARYCRTRYPPELAGRMEKLWSGFLDASQLLHWHDTRGEGAVWFGEPQYRLLATSAFVNLAPERLPRLQAELERFRTGLAAVAGGAGGIGGDRDRPARRSRAACGERDALDMARTIASRALVAALIRAALEMENWRAGKADGAAVRQRAELTRRLMDALADVLALSDDFSMHASLKHLEKAQPLNKVAPTINPHSELTLKSNAENSYCRSHHYELVRHVYRPELDAFWEWVLGRIESGDKTPWKRPAEFSRAGQADRGQVLRDPVGRRWRRRRRGNPRRWPRR